MGVRNVAIIAHVDHGKTTLVDEILKFSQSISSKEEAERVMDSGDLEREKGITITAKNTAIEYKGEKINIVDTPGHSDFGGEVERVLRMVETCLLLVDANEGPMPQTRFVLKKALELGHKILLVINKIDRPHIDIDRVIENTFELFLELDASDEQIEFPIIYASAKEGYAIKNLEDEKSTIEPLLEAIIEHVPTSPGNVENTFQFQVTTLDYDDYLGRICIGRVYDGGLKVGQAVTLQGEKGNSNHKITKLFTFLGLKRIETTEVIPGDIVAIAGIPEMTIGDTLTTDASTKPLTRIEIEPPTVSMLFKVNDSPFAGRDGKFLTSRQLKARLEKELMTNLSLKVEGEGENFKVSGRGELHLAVLIETMRREGFEMGVSKPEVILQRDENDKLEEPFEQLVLDLPEEHSGSIIQELNRRKGSMLKLENISDTFVRLNYEIPTRGIIGFRNFYLTETRGNGTLSGIFLGYRPFAGEFESRARGAIISMLDGVANTYALHSLQERGEMFIGPQTPVYEGMVIGLNNKDGDLDVNPIKEKKLTNMRASGSDDSLKLTPPRILGLEQALDLLADDEILEVTPANLRIRKKMLKASQRKRVRIA